MLNTQNENLAQVGIRQTTCGEIYIKKYKTGALEKHTSVTA